MFMRFPHWPLQPPRDEEEWKVNWLLECWDLPWHQSNQSHPFTTWDRFKKLCMEDCEWRSSGQISLPEVLYRDAQVESWFLRFEFQTDFSSESSIHNFFLESKVMSVWNWCRWWWGTPRNSRSQLIHKTFLPRGDQSTMRKPGWRWRKSKF